MNTLSMRRFVILVALCSGACASARFGGSHSANVGGPDAPRSRTESAPAVPSSNSVNTGNVTIGSATTGSVNAVPPDSKPASPR